jgi:perosamine synthetase
MRSPIPVNEPRLGGNEKKYLLECIDTKWISSEGPFVGELEKRLALQVGRNYGIAVANGSVALEVAVAALGVGKGDEVILPTFTIISCASAIVRAGATPVVVDSDPITWNMDVQQIEAKITSRTRAIMTVHIYGLPVDMAPLLDLAAGYKLKVIEDAAEMLGQTYQGRPCGSFGHLSTFSFYPNKLVTTGEGGMIVTDNEDLAERCRSLRNLCFQPRRRFVHEELGWNFRMSNVQAAVGLAQLERLEEAVSVKRRMGERYTALLSGLPQIQLPLAKTDYATNIYWVYGLLLKDNVPFDAAEVQRRLAEYRIGTRPFFWPMHEQPVFRKMGLFDGVSCPHAERLARRGFYLPSGLALTESQMDTVSQALKEVLEH